MHLIIKEFDHPEVNLPMHAIDRTSILLGENRVILLFLLLLFLRPPLPNDRLMDVKFDLHDSLSLSAPVQLFQGVLTVANIWQRCDSYLNKYFCF